MNKIIFYFEILLKIYIFKKKFIIKRLPVIYFTEIMRRIMFYFNFYFIFFLFCRSSSAKKTLFICVNCKHQVQCTLFCVNRNAKDINIFLLKILLIIFTKLCLYKYTCIKRFKNDYLQNFYYKRNFDFKYNAVIFNYFGFFLNRNSA